jgi:hypothetical protein
LDSTGSSFGGFFAGDFAREAEESGLVVVELEEEVEAKI